MDGGVWEATVHGGRKEDTTEQLTLSLSQKKKSFIALPGKGSLSEQMPSKLCVPIWRCSEKFYTNKRAGRDQDTVLISWWWGNWESASSAFWFQPAWGLCACGQYTGKFSHLVGASASAKHSMVLLWSSLEGEPGPATKLCCCFSRRSLHPLPSLISNCLNPLQELREGPGGWMKPTSYHQEIGDTERLLCPEPHRVLLSITNKH